LMEWQHDHGLFDQLGKSESRAGFSGLSYVKLGLAGVGNDWRERWLELATRLRGDFAFSCSWVAVSYVDWRAAGAPDPDAVIEAASTFEWCRGVLFDTWDKAGTESIDLGWRSRIERVRRTGRMVAIAGSLNLGRIEELAGLQPDIWAVRGAACKSGQRLGSIDPDRVAQLVEAVRRAGCRS
jgi:(5-formylfuran-3-yl)methyl phosphate synthase